MIAGFQEIERVFNAVADLAPEERIRYFRDHRTPEGVRKEVEALLAFDSEGSEALEGEISHITQYALAEMETADLPCGPYRLKELLGYGGMGTVYMAERVDGEVRQRVAVKLLRPGTHDRRSLERFLEERQILAGLSHSNIARLLDAGHREDGQPYLVMEYVDGEPIDVYAEKLGVREKVALVRKVCAAVSYLHRNLVVHRDLKPGNILVAADGQPKLLDFGIAKVMDPVEATRTSTRLLTPDYASPEQVAGAPLTTATDIYSLGAVLHKLLTGEAPGQAGVEVRGTGLDSDVQAILTKVLRAEPLERYATVEQFSEDLGNYLASRPIRARDGQLWYRTRKFLRRYWLPVGAGAIAAGGLTVGALVANHERAIAERRFDDVRQLANKLFDIDVEARRFAGSTKTRQLIVDTSLEYLKRLSADAARDTDLAFDVGNAYMRVARVQGVPIAQNLGQMEEAEKNLEIAERFMAGVLEGQPGNRKALLRRAQIAHDRMLLSRYFNRSDRALEFARKSAEWLERFNAGSGDAAEASAILNSYLNVSQQHMLSRQLDEAMRLAEQGIRLARLYGKEAHRGSFLWITAEIHQLRGDLEEALRQFRESESLLKAASGGDHGVAMNLVLALDLEGRLLARPGGISFGKAAEAAAVLDRAFRMADGFAHTDVSDHAARGRLASAGLDLAELLRDSDPRRSLAIYDHVRMHMGEIPSNVSFRRFEVSALAGSTYPLRRLGSEAEAGRRLSEALRQLDGIEGPVGDKVKPESERSEVLRAQAAYEGGRGNWSRSIEIYSRLLEQMRAWGAMPETELKDAAAVSRVYEALAAVCERAGERARADEVKKQQRELWRKWDAALPNNAFVRAQLKRAE